MEDSDRELRRAAAAACEAKRLGDAVPDLIRLLRDKDENVANAAHAALKRITKQNFDRTPGPWEAWWRAREDQ
jgi:HEAT repeat protein